MAKKGKKKLVMRKDYFGVGALSLFVGGVFFVLTVLTTATFFRFFIVGFFVILGLIDLILYAIFKER
ncbi:hypothetical protein CMO88_00130 [Candidatus Woesearchaeota archaeon]|nr:hypothetical protein [Candidatus Woesearchaeota archaeon]